MQRFQLRLLGSFQVALDGRPLTGFRSDKVRALLAYLAVEASHEHQRETLATLFWGENTESAARISLRQSLSNLNRLLGPLEPAGPILLITGLSVQLQAGHPELWLDVTIFSQLLAQCKTHPHDALSRCSLCAARLAQATELYRGDFLSGLLVADSQPFEEWRLVQQETFHQQALEALNALADYHIAIGDFQRAEAHARRQLGLSPWHEAAHRQLMQTLALDGQRSEALLQYAICRRLLAEELGVEPAPQTEALVETIRQGSSVATLAPSEVPHNLPAKATPFIGREAEIVQLRQWLLGRSCRLVTIFGAGGAGKTRLALAVARNVLPYFADGVWFVPLVEVGGDHDAGRPAPAPDLLAATIAAALGLSLPGQSNAMTQLKGYLRQKELLLVLDNFEHLLATTVDALIELLEVAPRLSLLVTSRERLNCQAEWAMRLEGLPIPAGDAAIGLEQASGYDSIQLFATRAGRPPISFSLGAETLGDVVHICRLVEGLPLAIELAATLTEQLTCAEIAGAIQENLELVAASLRDVPERHRSVRAVFDTSWDSLPPELQLVLAQLSVFRGLFRWEAAIAVTGARLSDLISLANKSLLRSVDSGQYSLHELIRHFAGQKLAGLGLAAEFGRRHSAYYLQFLSQQNPALQSGDSRQGLAAIRLELDNVRQAWLQAAVQGDVALLQGGIDAFVHFFWLSGLFQEGEKALALAADQVSNPAQAETTDEESSELLGQLLVGQARFLIGQAKYPQAVDVAGQAVNLASQRQALALEANGRLVRGRALTNLTEYPSAREQLAQALALARSLSSPAVEADVLCDLGTLAHVVGDYAEASKTYQEGLALYRRLGDRQGEAHVLSRLGSNYGVQDKLEEAREYFRQALAIAREIGARAQEGMALNNLGYTYTSTAQFSLAADYLRPALAIFREVGDRRGESHVLDGLGEYYHRLGDYAQAREYHEAAIKIKREIGERQGEGLLLTRLALLHHYLGDNESAATFSRQALAIYEALGNRLFQAEVLTCLGYALAALGRPDEATAAYRRARELGQAIDQTNLALAAQAGLAQLWLDQGQPAAALALVEEIVPALAAGHLAAVLELFRIHLTCYRVLRATRDPRARTVLETAYRQLQERAAAIREASLRHSFLHNVSENREIMSEWRVYESREFTGQARS
ncbi:MAG: tetratricopeptide repeat protein [Chloroflexi bacterium]|nr:tetratricopeptide repeat protein [Chloroflexota bacterium]MCI0578215.1 tetratricopeptide repeat protein [Chloroflexota bacterium]MCI0645292.1 tetratricopeptide repeat protein [Chloroflexota bacterium]MCI0729554.1 tetratricopeptide repeat protein [Chloroflexota bacterium]